MTESHYKEGKPLGLFFDCECDCDKHTVFTHRLSTLIHGRSKSCGCIKFNNPNIIEDLTGQKFGRLTVIGRDIERDKKDNKNGKNRTHWLCQCDCGNPKLASVTGHQLKSGHTQSCGCYASEQIAKRNKKYSTKINSYIKNNDNTITLLDDNNNKCLIDKEDYDVLKRWYWRKIEKRDNLGKGYWITNVKNDDKYKTSTLFIHQVVAEIKYGEYDRKIHVPDHLSRDTSDNRKRNIVLKSNQKNTHNRGLSKTNTSGKTGVSFSKSKGLWCAYITVNYNTIHLGDFDKYEDAVNARKEAEIKYGFTCDDIVASYDNAS